MILKDLNGRKVHISVYLSDDVEISKLNKEYRGKDYATDVLSFNINETMDDGTYYLGDVIVNMQQAERQASEFGNNVEQEISELAGHGILHLLGVHHDGDDH